MMAKEKSCRSSSSLNLIHDCKEKGPLDAQIDMLVLSTSRLTSFALQAHPRWDKGKHEIVTVLVLATDSGPTGRLHVSMWPIYG